jgi:ankyrin repeat protein
MVDMFGKNALMIAIENEHQAIVDLLAPLMWRDIFKDDIKRR